jgi:hypothetical protein
MRRIFTSPRLENVEAINQILVDAGISTRLMNARSWNRATKRDFSYAEAGRQANYQWPELWVVEADDYARARQVLRDAGVEIETTRAFGTKPSYLPDAAPRATEPVRKPYPWGQRIRLALIVIALGLAARHLLGWFGLT